MSDRNLLLAFDFDGTLADTRDDLVISTNHVRARFGLPPLSPAEVLDRVGLGAHRLAAATVGLPLEDPRTLEALAIFRDHYGAHQADHVRLYPGVAETLPALHGMARMAVVSNKPGDMVRRLAAHLGIDRWLDPLWGSEDVPALKPDPAGIRAAMALHGVGPERTLMVGDMPIDMEMGRAAGAITVFCTYGFRSLESLAQPPDHRIDRFPDLLAIVRKIPRS